ncbi:MAG: RNA 2',3'-cyclic phosphodiesterase [Acidimicrobiia bacterium]|nr:MAG: RNA 2',3'-cyclic phosphodiesterase [Acidimicrobiia bacterium]
MRIFVAVSLDGETRHALAHALSAGVASIPGKIVPPENWHLTLRFLGDVEEVACDRLLGCLSESDLGGAFTLRWEGLGAFPRPDRATVLWVGVGAGLDRLEALEDATDAAIDRAGFPAEERPFNPHLTLSRIRPPQDLTAILASAPGVSIPMAVDRIGVFRSRLGEGAPRYRLLEEFLLPSSAG